MKKEKETEESPAPGLKVFIIEKIINIAPTIFRSKISAL